MQLQQVPPFGLLPYDIQMVVLSFLPFKDAILRGNRVCKAWYRFLHTQQQPYFSYAIQEYNDDQESFHLFSKLPFKHRNEFATNHTLLFQNRTCVDWRKYFLMQQHLFKYGDHMPTNSTSTQHDDDDDDEDASSVHPIGLSYVHYVPYTGARPVGLQRCTLNSVVLGNGQKKLVVIGAYRAIVANQQTPLVHVYDIATQVFSAYNPDGYPTDTRLWRHSAVTIGTKVYVFGGSIRQTEKTNTLFTYNVETNQIGFPKVSGDIPCARSDHAACAVGTNMYVFGGSSPDVLPLNDLYCLDTITNIWRRVIGNGEAPEPRSGCCIQHCNGYLLVQAGGIWAKTHWQKKFTSTHWFHVATETWLDMKSHGAIPQAGTYPGCVAFGHYMLALCGGAENTVTSDVTLLNSLTGEWKYISYFSNQMTCDCPAVAMIDDSVYIFGGYCGVPKDYFVQLKLNWISLALDAMKPRIAL